MTKAQAEALLSVIDGPELVDVLTEVIWSLVGDGPPPSWGTVVEHAAAIAGWDAVTQARLREGEREPLERLVVELCELRTF